MDHDFEESVASSLLSPSATGEREREGDPLGLGPAKRYVVVAWDGFNADVFRIIA